MPIEILFIIIVILAALFFLVSRYIRRRTKKDRAYISAKWKEVEQYAETDALRAILEADKLLDIALEKSGYTGTLGEKLKKATKTFTNIDAVWGAHKFRNQLAHEIGAQVQQEKARIALQSFKKALQDLRFL